LSLDRPTGAPGDKGDEAIDGKSVPDVCPLKLFRIDPSQGVALLRSEASTAVLSGESKEVRLEAAVVAGGDVAPAAAPVAADGEVGLLTPVAADAADTAAAADAAAADGDAAERLKQAISSWPLMDH
jgi:hypothetical protein